MKLKRFFYFFIHLFFLSGLFYAFYHFITTPKSNMLHRRLWAYENWIIFSFYGLFVYLALQEREFRLSTAKKIKGELEKFKKILGLNLLLLIFPWGLALLLVDRELLKAIGLGSAYWRVLGAMSLIGALIYFFPYKFYRHKISFYILIFGAIDNFVAALIFAVLFALKRIPLIAFSATPLLFYYALFFFEQARHYKNLVKKS